MFNKLYDLICKVWQFGAIINDKLFRKGADFSKWADNKELGISVEQGNKYQPSTDMLIKVLKKMPIKETDCILDLGCGKGKALYMMSRFPFKKIAGYDISPNLIKIANDNIDKLNLTKCEVFVADAVSFTDYDEYTYFYLFNSFPRKVFEAAIDNIMDNLQKKPRKSYIIYFNPEHHDYLADNTPFVPFYEKKNPFIAWFKYRCYEYVPK